MKTNSNNYSILYSWVNWGLSFVVSNNEPAQQAHNPNLSDSQNGNVVKNHPNIGVSNARAKFKRNLIPSLMITKKQANPLPYQKLVHKYSKLGKPYKKWTQPKYLTLTERVEKLFRAQNHSNQ